MPPPRPCSRCFLSLGAILPLGPSHSAWDGFGPTLLALWISSWVCCLVLHGIIFGRIEGIGIRPSEIQFLGIFSLSTLVLRCVFKIRRRVFLFLKKHHQSNKLPCRLSVSSLAFHENAQVASTFELRRNSDRCGQSWRNWEDWLKFCFSFVRSYVVWPFFCTVEA